MASARVNLSSIRWRTFSSNAYYDISYSQHLLIVDSELEIHAMRMGPGKHLKGRTLMGGIVAPEEVRTSCDFSFICQVYNALFSV